MADVKISALPLASTPLAGTEVLPIVQSATTDRVTVANLTAGRAVSASSLTLTTTPLAVGSGGTGATAFTANYIPYSNGTILTSSANFTYAGTSLIVSAGTTNTTGLIRATADVANMDLVAFGSTATSFGMWNASEVGVFSTYPINIMTTGGSSVIKFATGGATERARIDASGNLLVNNTNGGSQVNFKNTVSNNTKNSIYIQNSSGTEQFRIYGDGAFATGTDAFSPYNYTSASAANVVVNSGGVLLRSTSSRRYKNNIQDAVHGLSDLLKLRSVTYNGINDGDKIFGGLIAEEVDAAGLTEFVVYDEEGKPDALHYGNMAGLFVKVIQELAAKVAALEAKK